MEFTQISERLVSGTGEIRIPSSNRKGRVYILYVDVIRPPRQEYKNFKWSPTQSLYARVSFLRNRYFVKEDTVTRKSQAFFFVNDIAGQTLIALKCAYQALVDNLAGIRQSLGLPPNPIIDPIEFYTNLLIQPDRLIFSCLDTTSLQLRLFQLKYDVCDPEKDDASDPPPPPPPLPELPPDQPIADISPPYEDADLPDESNPFPGDEIALGNVCTIFYDYEDLFDSSNNGFAFPSEEFRAVPPITIGAVRYFGASSRPPGTFLRSEVTVTDFVGNVIIVPLVNNMLNGHRVSNLTSNCE